MNGEQYKLEFPPHSQPDLMKPNWDEYPKKPTREIVDEEEIENNTALELQKIRGEISDSKGVEIPSDEDKDNPAFEYFGRFAEIKKKEKEEKKKQKKEKNKGTDFPKKYNNYLAR
ncbi:MAG: hypothetical protein NT165_00795 [Candidatus Falkowbacteria bacterium]|nr:hypothetical protein [Candidatus Falkowbacteria bacterium]